MALLASRLSSDSISSFNKAISLLVLRLVVATLEVLP